MELQEQIKQEELKQTEKVEEQKTEVESQRFQPLYNYSLPFNQLLFVQSEQAAHYLGEVSVLEDATEILGSSAVGEDGYHTACMTACGPSVVYLVVVEVEAAVAVHDCQATCLVVGSDDNEGTGVLVGIVKSDLYGIVKIFQLGNHTL